jgi:hypothetical protein
MVTHYCISEQPTAVGRWSQMLGERAARAHSAQLRPFGGQGAQLAGDRFFRRSLGVLP